MSLKPRARKPPITKPAWLAALGKVMFDGDSITADSSTSGDRSGYRDLLMKEIYDTYGYLMKVGDDVVGIQNPNSTQSTYPFCGASGMRSDQLYTTYVGNGSGDGLNADLYEPGLVILNIGTNDILQDYNGSLTDPTHIQTQLNLIIEAHKAANPNVKVVVTNLFDNNSQHAAFVTISAAITAYVQGRADHGTNTFLFDSFAAMGAWNATDWNGVTHLKNAGNVIYKNALFARLVSLFS